MHGKDAGELRFLIFFRPEFEEKKGGENYPMLSLIRADLGRLF